MGLMSAGGGGLTNSKLALATAEPSDVISGKTFYSGDKTLKTGQVVAVPVYGFSCTGGRQANPVYNRSYVQASGLGGQWKGSTGTIKILKAGYYTVAAAHYREVSSSPRFVFGGKSYYDSAMAAGWCNVGDTIMIYLPNQDGQGFFWSYGIGISCMG